MDEKRLSRRDFLQLAGLASGIPAAAQYEALAGYAAARQACVKCKEADPDWMTAELDAVAMACDHARQGRAVPAHEPAAVAREPQQVLVAGRREHAPLAGGESLYVDGRGLTLTLWLLDQVQPAVEHPHRRGRRRLPGRQDLPALVRLVRKHRVHPDARVRRPLHEQTEFVGRV